MDDGRDDRHQASDCVSPAVESFDENAVDGVAITVYLEEAGPEGIDRAGGVRAHSEAPQDDVFDAAHQAPTLGGLIDGQRPHQHRPGAQKLSAQDV